MEEQYLQMEHYCCPKYAAFATKEEYDALNHSIGMASNYPDEKSGTLRYSEENPEPIWDGKYYMQITSEVQMLYPLLLQGLELLDSIPVSPQEIP
jgi:hypothetical protein